MVTLQMLQRFPYFAELREENLKELAALTAPQLVPGGTRMFSEGDDANVLYLIVRGEVEIGYPLPGGQHQPIQTLGPGDLLVWSALVEPYKTTAEGVTKIDTELLAVDAVKLRALCESDPALAEALLRQVVKLLRARLENARAGLAAAGSGVA